MKKIFQWVDHQIHSQRTALIFLGIITAVVFFNMLPNGFIMDDFNFIHEWELIKDIRNLPRFFIGYIPPEQQIGIYSPLRTTFFSIFYFLFGENPIGWHVVGMMTHFFGVWAVYCLTQILMKHRWLSFLTALLFAVHPVHGENVAAITGSIDTIGIVLGLWAFYWYIRAVYPSRTEPVFTEDGALYNRVQSEKTDHSLYWRSFVLGAAAMLTHELVLTLPILIFMFDLLFLSPKLSWKRSLKRAAPFLLLFGAYVLMKASVLGGISRGDYAFGDPYRTFLIVIKAWAKYIGVLLVPIVLTHNKIISKGIVSFDDEDIDRASFFAQSWHDPQVLFSFALLFGIFISAIYLYRKKPLISFCIFWFYICLAPVAQIFPSMVYYAERYLYPGSWAFCLVLAWIFILLHKKLSKNRTVQAFYIFIIVAAIGAHAVRAMIRNRDFHDELTFYQKAVQYNPQSAYLKNDLGIIYTQAGNLNKAEKYFLEAIKMKPDNAYFYFSLADAYAMAERDEQAVAALKKAIKLDPDFAEAYFNLAGATAYHGNRELALKYLHKAVIEWRKQGNVFEAGEAVSSFFVFLASQDGNLKEKLLDEMMNTSYD